MNGHGRFSLNELYEDRDFYTPANNTFSPPAERLPHVIRFELTEGCNYGKCTYCNGYKNIPYREKSLDEYSEDLSEIFNSMERGLDLRRIFIGSNALDVEVEKLRLAIARTITKFHEYSRRSIERIAVYGNTKSIIKKGSTGLERLRKATKLPNISSGVFAYRDFGLDLIYWGVESGSSEVLDYVQKGCSQEDILQAGQIINDTARVDTSAMIITGLGGMKLYDNHVTQTAFVLGEIKPKFLTFMGINPPKGSLYERRMAKEVEEGKNRPLTDREKAEQMIEIIQLMPIDFRTKAGCFPSDIDEVGHNPLTFNTHILHNNSSKSRLANKLKRKLDLLQDDCSFYKDGIRFRGEFEIHL